MAHRRDVDEEEEEMDPEDDEEVDGYGGYDDEEEDEEEEEEEEDEEDEEYVGGKTGKKRGRSNNDASGRRGKKSKTGGVQDLLDLEAVVSDDEEGEEEDEGEEDFIVRDGADVPDEEDVRRMPRHSLFPHDDDQEEDIDAIQRHLEEKYGRREADYDDEGTEVDQQALLPSVRDPKLWMVKCAIGHEREVAVCLMQKALDKWPEIQIKSAIALDHLKNYIYIEADKEAHVKEACKGMRNIYAAKLMLVPIKEMTDVLSVESKATDLCRDTWVRMKTGTYKGDLAKIVDVDNVRQRATVKLIPRIDLQALASKLEGGREVQKKKAFTPPPRFMNIEEARDLHIRVERRRDPNTGDYFENIGGMMFKDGFLYKTVSIKSISTQNIHPTFDELEKFRRPTENGDGDMAGLSTLFSNRKKGHFVKGDRVIVVKGDLKNLKGSVEKVEEETVYIKSPESGILDTLAVNGKELCKYFEPGNHVKIVSGATEGATGMVVSVEVHVVNIVSDTTKELLRVFADNVVESSEVTTGITRIGDYELHDLVQLDDMSFGVIIRVETEAFQVLKGVPEKPEVAHVKLREIKSKLDKKINSQDRNGNRLSVKDIVKILEGPCRGKQGPIEHIFKGILFVYDRHHLEHAGFICAKSQSCILVGGSRANGNKNVDPFPSRYPDLRSPSRAPQSPMRPPRDGRPLNPGGRFGGGRGHNNLVDAKIKIRKGFYKGCKGVVKDVKGNTVRVELEAQMKVVTVNRDDIADVSSDLSTPFRGPSRFTPGSETPIYPSRTPLRPYMTPMRDVAATPIHDGMRTPMPDRAWNPYTPMTPAREEWEDGNPASWGTSPRYQPGSPRSRTYEAPTPAHSEAGTPRDGNAPSPYLPSTPGGQPPMTPNSASLPGTPGGQPMTPGDGGLDMMMSPAIGGDNEGGATLLPEILVKVHVNGADGELGVIKEVLPDGSCKITVGGLNGKVVTGQPNEVEVVTPRKNDRVKVIGGTHRGAVGKLVGIDGTDGIVKLDITLDVKILFLDHIATLVQQS